MKTEKFRLERETEKAILFTIGFKFNENAPKIVCGVTGEQDYREGREVTAWIPKSVISNGEVADWFARKMVKESFGMFNPFSDMIYS